MTLFLLMIVALQALPAAQEPARERILFVGNSITAGMGLPREQAYPALIQQKLDSAGLSYVAINAGLSGETTSGGLRRLGWLLAEPAAVVVIALGGNDGLRGIAPELTAENLRRMIDTVRSRADGAAILLAGMEAPPNMGPQYTERFRTTFRAVAREKRVALIPFLLKDVGGIADLNQADRIHPNARGQQVVAATVWRTLEPILRAGSGDR